MRPEAAKNIEAPFAVPKARPPSALPAHMQKTTTDFDKLFRASPMPKVLRRSLSMKPLIIILSSLRYLTSYQLFPADG